MGSRKLPPNDVLAELYNTGLSARDIANRIGANVNTVASALTRMGICRASRETIKMQFDRGDRKPPGVWSGKKQPQEMVERRISKIRGERHYLWKGGKSARGYRNMVDKKVCAMCGATEKLAIHHINLDHYDNTPENLQVLCSSCHQSLHKTLYWSSRRKNHEN